jgi:hypothetical protein
MDRPSKKEIKAAVDKLKNKSEGSQPTGKQEGGKLTDKKTSRRIRKQGI